MLFIHQYRSGVSSVNIVTSGLGDLCSLPGSGNDGIIFPPRHSDPPAFGSTGPTMQWVMGGILSQE